MGGRGTFAAGNNVAYKYETVDKIEGVKVLKPLSGSLKLPEEAHSSGAYVLLDRSGVFKQYREYDKDHYLTFEIGWHHEPKIDPKADKVFHVHEYTRDFGRTTRPITPAEFEKYKKFFKGVRL